MTWNDIPRHPSATTLRQFAGLWLLFFGGFGLWHLAHGRPSEGELLSFGTVLLLVSVAGLPGLIWPGLLRPVFVGWLMAVFPIGWLMSRALLTALYFGLFTPLAAFFRLRGRDALQLRPITVDSYWQPKPQPKEVRSYFRQFTDAEQVARSGRGLA
jgi:hypothetical protein